MPLLNYTTSIESSKTIGEIQAMLARHGASHVGLGYRDGRVESVTFVIALEGSDIQYRLPARTANVLATLQRQQRAGKLQRRFAVPEQAERVAWRITKDWLEAQLAIVESGMVALDEVMLPYALARDGKTTVYQLARGQMLGLPAPNGEPK